jgi:hypothetical protein
MRRFALVWLLLAGAGCQGLHEKHCRSDGTTGTCPAPLAPCTVPEKKVSAPAPEAPKAPEKVGVPVGQPAQVAIAQEVLLVPRMVYMPFVAQSPTAPARLTSNMTVLPPTGAPVGAPQPPVGAPSPPPVGAPPCESEMLDLCRKLNQRLDYLEKCIRDRPAPPTVICPPATPACPLPLLHRPWLNRCEPVANPCDTQCDQWRPCDPLAPAEPVGMPAQKLPMGK